MQLWRPKSELDEINSGYVDQVSHCVKKELFFTKPGVKVNGQYYWDILLTQQMLTAIKHIAAVSFVFHAAQHIATLGEQHSPPAAVNNSQLHFFCVMNAQQPTA